MSATAEKDPFFSDICMKRCRGLCCDPWWGIISYTVIKEGGLSDLNGFKSELAGGVKAREKRIVESYVTSEDPPRPLFSRPERYNITLREVKVIGTKLQLNLLAMYAFRCSFLSGDKVCTIHPALLEGREVRPPHCGYMGRLDVNAGEKGYCRIIHAAHKDAEADIEMAIAAEKGASARHYGGGAATAEEAAQTVMGELKDWCLKHAPQLLPQQKSQAPGRNDPCWCGSNRKFKKCHGV